MKYISIEHLLDKLVLPGDCIHLDLITMVTDLCLIHIWYDLYMCVYVNQNNSHKVLV